MVEGGNGILFQLYSSIPPSFLEEAHDKSWTMGSAVSSSGFRVSPSSVNPLEGPWHTLYLPKDMTQSPKLSLSSAMLIKKSNQESTTIRKFSTAQQSQTPLPIQVVFVSLTSERGTPNEEMPLADRPVRQTCETSS